MRQRLLLKAILVGVVLGLLVVAQQGPMRCAYALSDGGGDQWLEHLHRWLSVSYSEGEKFAGFGDLGSEQISIPSLYATYGTVHVLHYAGVGIEGARSVGRWVNSLLTDEGAYDDPSENAPLVFETLWAVTALDLLGVPPEQPSKTAQFILKLQGKDGLFHYDSVIKSSLGNNVACTYLAVRILPLLGVERTDLVSLALEKAAQRIASLVHERLGNSPSGHTHVQGDDDYDLQTALAVYASLDPQGFPLEGKGKLEQYLAGIQADDRSFHWASKINELLDAAEVVGIVGRDEIPSLPGLQECLVQRITPELLGLGGYGWRSGWAGRLDPVMTWPTVRMFARAQLPYPYRALLIETVQRYRMEKGWSSYTIPVPEADFTYFGLVIAESVGWTEYDRQKILSYAMSILESPQANPHDLFWAARLAEMLGESTAKIHSMLRLEIAEVYAEGSQDEYWVIPLLAEFSLSPSPHLALQLRETAEELATMVAKTPYMQHARHLVFLQQILKHNWISEEALSATILSLQLRSTGGFKAAAISSGADLLSTHSAIKALTTLGSWAAIDTDKCISFVMSRQEEYGYSWGAEASPPDLYSTYVGISNLQLLRAMAEKRMTR